MKKILFFLFLFTLLALAGCGMEETHEHVDEMDDDHEHHDTMDTMDMDHDTMEHMHEQMAVDSWEAIPSISLSVMDDPKSGWNLHADVENFVFSPEHASTEHIDGEGHAHLYIDGEKITRLYAEWYYIGSLDPGAHEVVVTLNGNAHEDYTLNGEVIQDSVIIIVE